MPEKSIMSLLAACALAMPGVVLAQQAPAPAFKPDRSAEDYSYLKETQSLSAIDKIKYVRLDSDGNVYVSFGGEIRERAEAIDRPLFGVGGREADDYLLQRVLVHADLHLGQALRIFGQVGSEKAFGKNVLAAPDEDDLDVQQLFVELKPSSRLAVRLGRQEMSFNASQRFVSFRDGTNVRQNFDGVRARLNLGRLRLEGFAVRPVRLERGVFDDVGNDEQTFAGMYASMAAGRNRSATIDPYWFYLRRAVASYGGVTGEENRHSLGVRSGGSSGRWDWDVEGLRQTGSFAGDAIRAWGLAADLGYTAPSGWRPRFGLRYDSGSGDRRPGDGRLGTFNPLFPKGPYFSEANVTSFANLVALRPSLKVQPLKALSFETAAQWKWKEQRADSVYLGPAAPLAGTRGGPTEIGRIYTADANLQLGRHWSLRGYYLHHTAGAAIRQVGGHAIDFGMGSLQFRF